MPGGTGMPAKMAGQNMMMPGTGASSMPMMGDRGAKMMAALQSVISKTKSRKSKSKKVARRPGHKGRPTTSRGFEGTVGGY